MNEFEHFRASDAGAQLEGRAPAVVALLLKGIGFWQHYDNYVDAEEGRASIAGEQTALEPTDDSTMAVTPATSETFEHAKMRVQLSDISWRDCRNRQPGAEHLSSFTALSILFRCLRRATSSSAIPIADS